MTLAETFKRLGLPKHAATIYTTLEKSGPLHMSALCRETRIHRPALYRTMTALLEKRIVTSKSVGRRTYFAAGPRAAISRLFDEASSDVHALAKRDISESMGTVQYFTGDAGITAVFNDVVAHSKRGDTFYRYTSERDLDAVNKLLSSDYRKRRDAKRLERLVISNPESGGRKRSRLERFIKFLGTGKESFSHNAIQLVYGKRIAFIDLNAGESIIIENETLAAFQKTIFRALYARL